jgi:acyl-CoA thioesterase
MDNETDFLEPVNDGLDPKIFTQIIDFCRADYFSHCMGIRMTRLAPGKTYAELDPEALHSNMSGFLHGGVTVTLADLSMGIACFTTGFVVVTSNINISYLTVGEIGQKITAVGQVLHSEKNTMFAESHIKNRQGKVVAKATGIFSIVSLKKPS